jgi:DNA-binding NtrC family response regulator
VPQSKETILVVEDEEIARKNLEYILNKEGYEVVSANSGAKAIELLKNRPFDLVITDLKMEKVDGMEVLRKSKELHPHAEVIMITGYATVESAVKAMRDGSYHYIAKPYKIDEVRSITREALLKRKLVLENIELKQSLKKSKQMPLVIGNSEAIASVKRSIEQIAPSDSNVLILGESGTGKELTAKAIHRLSPRSEKKFIAFNCGSFAEELMANELFGHEKDAYTGATGRKAGLLETGHGGIVFLDEIGDMPMSMQVKLLRVIQEKEFLRVGGVEPIPVDVRFIAATHRDLKEDVEKGLFRQDLYYRINVITIQMPPLADREEDIPLLAYHFLAQSSEAMSKHIQEIDREAMAVLSRYSWPGNIRELENVIESSVVLGKAPSIRMEDLPEYIRDLSIETYRHRSSEIPTLEEHEKRYIQWILEKSERNKSKAAKLLGIDRVSLWRKMKKYGL